MKKVLTLLNLIVLGLMLVLFASCSCSSLGEKNIRFEKNWITIDVGEEQELIVESDFDDEIEYSTSNKNLVAISETGKVTGVAAGTAEIYATVEDSTAKCFVTVISPDVTVGPTILLDKTEMLFYYGNDFEYQLNAALYSNGQILESKLTFTSSDSAVITVSETGVVRAVNLGAAFITVSTEYEGATITAVCKVTVREKLTLNFTSGNSISIKAGDKIKIGTEIKDKDGITVERPITWLSTNDSIASVNANGELIAKTGGEIQVIADINGEKFVQNVRVMNVTQISTTKEFMAIASATKYDYYELVQDITVNLNGVWTVKEGSDACLNKIGTDGEMTVFTSFAGTLDGNGHKISIINTDSFSQDFALLGGANGYDAVHLLGIFNKIERGAEIKNTVFDISIASYAHRYTGTCVFALHTYGRVENCLIKVACGEPTSDSYPQDAKINNSSVFRTVYADSEINNVIFDLMGVIAVYKNDGSVTNSLCITDKKFINSGSGSIANSKTVNNYSDIINDTNVIGQSGCNFVKDGEVVTLCGKQAVQVEYEDKHVTTAAQFVEYMSASYGGKIVNIILDNDITVKLNGIGTPKVGSDMCLTSVGTDGEMTVFNNFAGRLNGQGHKITIINTDSFSDDFAELGGANLYDAVHLLGIFRTIANGAVIKDTAFDISIASYNHRYTGTCGLALNLNGTLENCLIKLNMGEPAANSYPQDSNVNRSTVIRNVNDGAKVNNVIFDLKGISAVYDIKEGGTLSNCLYITDKSFRFNSGTYTNCTGVSYFDEILSDTSVLGKTGCNFVKDGNVIKLCGREVMSSTLVDKRTHITSAQDFLKIKDNPSGTYILDNNITVTVDGVNRIANSANACWTLTGSEKDTYLFNKFSGTFDGQGHKVTIVNTVSLADSEVSEKYYLKGIFKEVSEGSVIKNTVFDVQVNGNFTPIYNAPSNKIDLFSTDMAGTIQDCVFKGTVTNSTITASVNMLGNIFATGVVKNVIFDTTCITEDVWGMFNVRSGGTVQNAMAIGRVGVNCQGDSGYSTDVPYVDNFGALLSSTELIFATGNTTQFTKNGTEIKLCGVTVINSSGVI